MAQTYTNSSEFTPNIYFKIVHAIRGRIRFNIPLISEDPDYTERLEKAINNLPSITGTRINRTAASIIINYNPSQIADAQIQAKIAELINSVALEQALAYSTAKFSPTPAPITTTEELPENDNSQETTILVEQNTESEEEILSPENNILEPEEISSEANNETEEKLPEILPPVISKSTIEALENSYLEPTNLENYADEENTISPASASTLTLATPSTSEDITAIPENEYLNEIPDDVEMSLFDHLEELRQRIFYSLLAVVIAAGGSFFAVKPIVQFLEVPAQNVKFIQIAPGEYFFVSVKTAAYSGILLATPFILYQIIQFVIPGLTRRERRFLAPIVFGSSILFVAGLAFSYIALIPAALNFLINYGEGVVEQLLSIDRYFEFVLLLMLSTGLAFQIPVIQMLLGLLGIVSSKQMLSGWRYVFLGGAVLGAVLTPSTDPITQMLLAGAVIGLYFGGTGAVMLLGR